MSQIFFHPLTQLSKRLANRELWRKERKKAKRKARNQAIQKIKKPKCHKQDPTINNTPNQIKNNLNKTKKKSDTQDEQLKEMFNI